MENQNKSQNNLILVLLVIVVISAILTIGILLYTKNLNNTNTEVNNGNTSATLIQETYPPSGNTTLELRETSELEYDLYINTNGDDLSGIDVQFEYDPSKIDFNVENANLADFQEPFLASKKDGILSIQVGTLNSFKGDGVIAKIKVSKLTGFVPTTMELSENTQVFVSDELNKNYLSPAMIGYSIVIN